ncbi:MAG: peptidase S41, partial [Sphingobacteriia bacterium]
GTKLVFEKDYAIWLYNTSSDKAEKLSLQLLRNNTLTADKDFDVRGTISNMDISPDGKKIAFIARGELFVSDVEGKFIQKINKQNTERAKEVKWLSDNRTLLFNQTINGYLNLFTVNADGTGTPKQVTTGNKDNRSIALNKSKSKAVFLSGRDEVKIIDTKTWISTTMVKDEIWAFQNSSPSFSPNEEYILFTAYRNFEQDILIHHIANNKTTNLTNTGISEADPIWSPDSKYIYFISNRTKPAYPMGMANPRIYRMPLDKYDEPYRVDKFNDLFKVEKKDTTKKEPSNPPIVINIEKAMDRLEQIGSSFGSQYLLSVLQKGDKTTVLYVSDHAEGKPSLWKSTMEAFFMEIYYRTFRSN